MRLNNLLKFLLSLSLLTGVMFSLDAAVKSKRKTTSKTRTTATAPKVMEGKITEYGNLITFQNFTIKKGESEISVDYPIAGDPTLVNPIRSYIVKAITGKTDATAASLSTPKNLLTSTIRKYKSKGYWGMTDGSVFTLNIKVVFKNDKVITIENSGYEYEGGAHGTGWDRFITYLLSDGTYLSYDMIPSFKTLKPYILSSLEKVFGIPAYKFNDEGIYVNELPDGLPYINENGVNFTYGEYEIGPYSLGLPTATIPFSTMRILCSGKALNFF